MRLYLVLTNTDAPFGILARDEGSCMTPYMWLGVAVIMAIIEAASVSLVTVWFFIGALVAFCAALAGASQIAQVAVFLIVSVLSLVLFRPVIVKYRKHGAAHEPTPVGQYAVVVEAIDNGALKGRVETPDHMTWTALSKDGTPIEAGASVRVVGQQSIKLIVERI